MGEQITRIYLLMFQYVIEIHILAYRVPCSISSYPCPEILLLFTQKFNTQNKVHAKFIILGPESNFIKIIADQLI